MSDAALASLSRGDYTLMWISSGLPTIRPDSEANRVDRDWRSSFSICRRDDWPVFSAFFQRQESANPAGDRTAFRLDTAHARLITHDDELLL